MARRRRERDRPLPGDAGRTSRQRSKRYRRDTLRIARAILSRRIALPLQTRPSRSGRPFRDEDRRRWRPEVVPPLAGKRSPPRVSASKRRAGRVQFRRTREPTICDRRRERRQVMFARR